MVPDKLSLQQLGPTIGTSMMPQKLIDYLLADSKQAVDDFSDYPSQGDYYGPDGNVVSGPAGAPQGAHHAGSAVSKAVDRAVQNAVIDALVNAVGPEESALSAGYMADLGYGGAFAAGGTGGEGLGDNMGGFGSGWT